MPNAQFQEAPPALVGHSALSLTVSTQGQLAKDSILNVGSKMIVFGGGDGRQANNHTALVDSTTFTYTVINVRGAPPAHKLLGDVLVEQRAYEEAALAYQEALALVEGDAVLTTMYKKLLRTVYGDYLGKPQEAAKFR